MKKKAGTSRAGTERASGRSGPSRVKPAPVTAAPSWAFSASPRLYSGATRGASDRAESLCAPPIAPPYRNTALARSQAPPAAALVKTSGSFAASARCFSQESWMARSSSGLQAVWPTPT